MSIHNCHIHVDYAKPLVTLSRYIDKPDRVRSEPRNNRPRHKTDKASKEGKGQNVEELTNHHTDDIKEDVRENYLQNKDMVPYVTRKFLGCDVTMDDDHIANEVQHALQRV